RPLLEEAVLGYLHNESGFGQVLRAALFVVRAVLWAAACQFLVVGSLLIALFLCVLVSLWRLLSVRPFSGLPRMGACPGGLQLLQLGPTPPHFCAKSQE
ncbi:hypothetical protein EGN72_00295, partial [Pseudorhodobacter sp. E13]